MIYYCLFGKLMGNLELVLHDLKLIKNYPGGDRLDPQILFGMAKALYSIGQELSVGAFKTLNLTKYLLVSKSCTDTLLVLVMETSKKNSVQIPQIEVKMESLLTLFNENLSKLNDSIGETPQINFKAFKKLFFDEVPFLKKAIKRLELKPIEL